MKFIIHMGWEDGNGVKNMAEVVVWEELTIF